MSWFPPPPPFVGGAQPYQPARLPGIAVAHEFDNPPLLTAARSRARSRLSACGSLNPWVSDVIGTGANGGPYLVRQLSPGVPGQSADPPLPIDPARTELERIIGMMWQPDPLDLQFPGRRRAVRAQAKFAGRAWAVC